MAKAWKEEIPPSWSSALEREPATSRSMAPKRRNWTARVRSVKYRPTAISAQARKPP